MSTKIAVSQSTRNLACGAIEHDLGDLQRRRNEAAARGTAEGNRAARHYQWRIDRLVEAWDELMERRTTRFEREAKS